MSEHRYLYRMDLRRRALPASEYLGTTAVAKTVLVWGLAHEVIVRKTLTSVWVASGEYMGSKLSVEDRSLSGALAAWRAAAYRRGDE